MEILMKTGSAYSEAINSGQYRKELGLIRKYDNVRIYWEDEATRIFLRPYLEKLVAAKEARLERMRILDLGCGSGDGFELLKGIRRRGNDLITQEIYAINKEDLGLYLGLDSNPELIKQARKIYDGSPKLDFVQGNFSDIVSILNGYESFDLFFSSYGTMSHCSDEQFVELMLQIMEVCGDYAIVVCDWLGRYVYAWQDIWERDCSKSQCIDYRISYIYPDDERKDLELESFPLRIMAPEEVLRLIGQINRKGKKKVDVLGLNDRSVFVSRHMDTGDYNKRCQPIRRQVNSLHEDFMRTRLEDLIIDYCPKAGLPEINSHLEKLQLCWNTLVKYTIHLFESYDRETEAFREEKEISGGYPKALVKGMNEMKKVIQGTGWIQTGDARANMIEPHLGYCLRQIELEMQQGLGVGHGLVAILEIHK
jgi:SAM-dependent methyltransferase